MAKRDYYETLGVGRKANADELKNAFRKRAKELHPDRNPGDKNAEAQFKELNEAYDVLKDEQKRAAYDQFGHQAFEGGGGGRGHPGFDFNATSFSDVFDDLFGEFMGGRRNANPNRPSRGADMRFNIEITLEEAFAGKQATIRVPTSIACEPCGGSGAEPGTKPQTCPTCAGVGKVRAQQGFFTIERSCPACNGNGRIVKNPCKTCGGGGRVQKEKTLNVAIPAGIEDGSKIRVTGEGEAGQRGGPKGDLYLFLSIAPHPIFRREGPHVQCRVPVTMATAALGGSIDVPTLGGGKASVKIPEGAQNGKQFRLRGKGMPVMRGQGAGDMFVEIAVETPVNLTKKQQELLREFEKAGTQQNNPESSSFFARVKEFFDGGKT